MSKVARVGQAPFKRRELQQPEQHSAAAERDERMRRLIAAIPRGKVATYAQVAAAAGYPHHQRQVTRILRQAAGALPWQRVVGAGGRIKLRRAMALEQRLRLEAEGVSFRGRCVDLKRHQHQFPVAEPGSTR